MFKFCGIIGISKTEFFKFPGTERVKQNPPPPKKKKERKNQNYSKPPRLVRQLLFKKFQQKLTEPCWAGNNSDLHTNSNILRAGKISIILTRTFFKEYSISSLVIRRLTGFVLVVLYLWLLMFKSCWIIGI